MDDTNRGGLVRAFQVGGMLHVTRENITESNWIFPYEWIIDQMKMRLGPPHKAGMFSHLGMVPMGKRERTKAGPSCRRASLQRPKGSENRIGELKLGRSGQASLARASQLFSSAVKILIEHQTMARKHKKTKEWKRWQEKIKERQRSREAVIASQEKLLQRVKNKSANDGNKFRVEKRSSQQKMSEVIIDFAKPLLDAAQTDEEMQRAIGMAIAMWNVAILPDKEQKNFIREFFDNTKDSSSNQELPEEYDQVVSYFIARKKAFFSDIERMILDYECVETQQGFHLNVVSTELHER